MSDLGNGVSGASFMGGGVPPIPAYGLALQKEQAWHKMAAVLYAHGTSGAQIARELEKTPQAISNLIRQPFFQERVAGIMAETARDIGELFRAERINTLATLIALRDDPSTPPAVKATVCRELFDRSMGRPVQPITASTEVRSDDPCAEYAMLEAENKRLRDSLEPGV
jgi:hypothetical protein